MSPEFWVALTVVTIAVLSGVILFRSMRGFYPGSKMIIEDPPIEHNGLEPQTARFIMFYTTWCPWSLKAQKPWRSFKQQLKNTPKKYNGYSVSLEEVNAEADKGKAALYKIKAFPTFKVETPQKVVQFQGVPDPLTFDTFLTSALA